MSFRLTVQDALLSWLNLTIWKTIFSLKFVPKSNREQAGVNRETLEDQSVSDVPNLVEKVVFEAPNPKN